MGNKILKDLEEAVKFLIKKGKHMNIPVFAVSIITDIGIGESHHKINHEEVLQFAKAAEPKLATIFKTLVAGL